MKTEIGIIDDHSFEGFLDPQGTSYQLLSILPNSPTPKLTSIFEALLLSVNRIFPHCKYIRPDYDGTLAIHSSSTMIHCRDQLQRKIWKFLI